MCKERPELVPFDRMAPADELTSTVATIFTSILLDTSTVENTSSERKRTKEDEIVMWVIICIACCVLGIALVTCQFFWDWYHSHENLHKRKVETSELNKKKEDKAIAAIKKEPIQVDQFLQRLRQKKLDKYLNFEVRAIVRNQEEYPCKIATLPENIAKNVCQEVLTYDHSCVNLRDVPEGYDSEYINASFIQGYDGGKEYIATSGPRGKVVPAFWHMVWQEGVHCIVMATGLFENSVQQCDKYWGDVLSVQKYVRQGDIHICLDSILELSKLVIRTFHIQKDGCDERRLVKHFEMIGFNDESTDPGFLLDVRRRVNKFMLSTSGPLLVHCRCGGGKTAVFIAIDFCLKQLEVEKFVDIYSTVLYLRKFRRNMVRTLAQYRLIYDTLALHVQAWTTVVPSSQLPALAHRLSLKDPVTHMQGFEREFKLFQDIVPNIPIGDCASGHRDENRNKSRDIMLLPPERARPYLQTMESHVREQGTDFINAVFVDGHHQNSNFIVTQWPMQSTINDIWRLLYDFKISSLVVLNDTKCSRSFPCFWPKDLDVEVKYGPIGVKYVGCQKYPHIIIRAFAIRKRATCLPLIDVINAENDSTIVKMFQYTSWHHRDRTPLSTKSFLYMMGSVTEWQENNNSFKPICIMSKDGYSKSGIYCALSICCEQLHSEKEVDIFNAVRIVKQNRPQLIPTVNEYIYCYNYMSLVLNLIQDDTPKIVVSSPNVIEGEIRQGYEQITGFQNIYTSLDEEEEQKQTKHSHQTSSSFKDRKNQRQSNQRQSIEDPEAVQPTSNNGLCSFDIGKPGTTNNNTKYDPNRKHLRHSFEESRHVRENGYLVENENHSYHRQNSDIVAPKAPGRIRTSYSFEYDSENRSVSSYTELKRHSTKRKPFKRQDAKELIDLSPEVEIHVGGSKRSFESSC